MPYRHRRSLRFFIVGVVLLLLILIIFIFLPKAEVILKVASEPLRTNFEVKLNSEVNKVLNNLDIIPAQTIKITVNDFKKEELQDLIINKIEKKIDKNQIFLKEFIYQQINSSGEAEVIALVYKKADIEQIIQNKLAQIVPSDKEIMVNSIGTTDYEVVTFKPQEAQGIVKIRLVRTIIPKLDFAKITKELTGQTPAEAQKYLDNLRGIKEAKIRISGNLLGKMPLINRRIKLKLDTF